MIGHRVLGDSSDEGSQSDTSTDSSVDDEPMAARTSRTRTRTQRSGRRSAADVDDDTDDEAGSTTGSKPGSKAGTSGKGGQRSNAASGDGGAGSKAGSATGSKAGAGDKDDSEAAPDKAKSKGTGGEGDDESLAVAAAVAAVSAKEKQQEKQRAKRKARRAAAGKYAHMDFLVKWRGLPYSECTWEVRSCSVAACTRARAACSNTLLPSRPALLPTQTGADLGGDESMAAYFERRERTRFGLNNRLQTLQRIQRPTPEQFVKIDKPPTDNEVCARGCLGPATVRGHAVVTRAMGGVRRA